MKLEFFLKETNEWKLVNESDNKSELELNIELTEETPEWRILVNDEIIGSYSIASPNEELILELQGEYKGVDVMRVLESSLHLKERGYFIQNSYTTYRERGPVLEINDNKRIKEINIEKAQSHDVFFGCFDEGDVIYLQIWPFTSNEIISKLNYSINSGDTLTVLKDLNEFVNELKKI